MNMCEILLRVLVHNFNLPWVVVLLQTKEMSKNSPGELDRGIVGKCVQKSS